jgi:hypothetical protein
MCAESCCGTPLLRLFPHRSSDECRNARYMKTSKKWTITFQFVLLLLLGIVVGKHLRNEPQTLPPTDFSGRAREAYQVAHDHPALLAALPCFCGCMRHLGHNSALDCFKNDHGEYCSICQDIALQAEGLQRRGLSTAQIVKIVTATYHNN